MDPDKIDYPAILQDALRDAVRRILEQVSEHGMPGDHHFYLSFQTDFPGVEVPRFLREQYPEEATIILQHQFWGLEVGPEDFSVLLSFGGSRQRVRVPFAALTAFADPAAAFGLRFQEILAEPGPVSPAEPEAKKPAGPSRPSQPGEVIQFDPSRRR